MYGIKLNNLSFSNLNFGELYLKYDKKLFVEAKDFSYDTHKLDFNITLDGDGSDFVLKLENVVYKNLNMNLGGEILLSDEAIDKLLGDPKKELMIDKFNIVFDKNLPSLKSDKLFVTLNKDIFLNFNKPTLDGIKLDKSNISLLNLDSDGILKIELFTNNILDLKLLKVLAHYEVELPALQLSGRNSTSLKLDFPFKKGEYTNLLVVSKLQNGVIKIGDNGIKVKKTPPNPETKINVKVLVELANNTLLYENNIVKSKLLNVSINNSKIDVASKENQLINPKINAIIENLNLSLLNNQIKFSSDVKDEKTNSIALSGDTNLNTKETSGILKIYNITDGKMVSLDSKELQFKVWHKPLAVHLNGNFGANIKFGNNQSKRVEFTNFVADFKNKIVNIATNILEENNIFKLLNTTSLDTNSSNGEVFVSNFEYEKTAQIKNQTIRYNAIHSPLNVNIKTNLEALITLNNNDTNSSKIVSLENLNGDFKNNQLAIEAILKEGANNATISHRSDFDKNVSSGIFVVNNFTNDFISKLQNQTLNYTITHNPLKAHIVSNISATIKDRDIRLENLDVIYDKNIIDINTNLIENNNSLFITNSTSHDTNISNGFLYISNLFIDKNLNFVNEFLPYSFSFLGGLEVRIPKYDLLYKKDEEKQNIVVGKLNSFLSKINHIEDKKEFDGSLYLYTTDNFNSMNVFVNDLGIDINSSLFKDENKTNNQETQNTKTSSNEISETKDTFVIPKISAKIFNSKVQVDGALFNSAYIFGDINKEKIDIKYQPTEEENTIDFHKDGDNLTLRARDLTNSFLKNLANKDILQDGRFDISVDGNKTNLFGSVYARSTTVKNVRILNNLITFINTTPALINPILVLPTLFRMGETNFDTNGYFVKDGYLSFDYDYGSKILNLPSFHTKSKMMDFKGSGVVDLKNETISIPINIIFLKDYSKFLNHIPIIGHIITGDDGNFVTNVDIKGNFEEQEFETHIVKNTSDGVFGVVKRIFMTPFRLFEKLTNTLNEEDKKSDNSNENTTKNEGN